jgi:RND superfamily putative drug exporter
MTVSSLLHAPQTVRSSNSFERFARYVLRHRRLVGITALVIGIAGVLLAGPIAGRLSTSENFPGLSSFNADQSILRIYGNGGTVSPIVLMATLPAGEQVTTPRGAQELAETFASLHEHSSWRVVDYPQLHDRRLVSSDGRSALALVFTGNSAPPSAKVAASLRTDAPAGVTIAATSLPDLYSAPGHSSVGVLGETLLGGAGALLVLAFVFGSFLAILPLLIAGVSILGTFLALGAITTVTPVSQLVEFLVSLIGLGIAIDYSLLVVTRWREERRRGATNDDAVVTAMATAGRTVAFSGVTVAIGLFALVVLPIGFLRSLGYGGLLIPLVTVAVTLTILPVLLATWGPRLDRRRWRRTTERSRRQGQGSAWSAWTRAVIRHRLLAIGAALVILGVLIGAAIGIRVGEIAPNSVSGPDSAESGLLSLERAGFPAGMLQPMEVLVPAGEHPTRLAGHLTSLTGVDAVLSPADPGWHRDGTTVLAVIPRAVTSGEGGTATVSAVRQAVATSAPRAQVGGDPAQESDVLNAYYSRFPLILFIVGIVSLLALARAFRSWVLPVKALLLNAVSLTAAYGSLVLVWQHGLGSRSLWGVPATGVVIDFVPLVLFAFLFGLSMDYEVFILARIKEAHDAGMSTDDAVVQGLGQTGRLVTSAAIILFLAFSALASGPSVPLKIFATGMALGIFIDATVIRALLLPAVLSLLGRWAWWAPSRLLKSHRLAAQPATVSRLVRPAHPQSAAPTAEPSSTRMRSGERVEQVEMISYDRVTTASTFGSVGTHDTQGGAREI